MKRTKDRILISALCFLSLYSCSGVKKETKSLQSTKTNYQDSLIPSATYYIDNSIESNIVLNKNLKLTFPAKMFYDSINKIYPKNVKLSIKYSDNPFILANIEKIARDNMNYTNENSNINFYINVVNPDNYEIKKKHTLSIYSKGNAYKVAYIDGLNKKIREIKPIMDREFKVPPSDLPDEIAKTKIPLIDKRKWYTYTLVEESLYSNILPSHIIYSGIPFFNSKHQELSNHNLTVKISNARIPLKNINVVAFLDGNSRNWYHIMQYDSLGGVYALDKRLDIKSGIPNGQKLVVVAYSFDDQGWIWDSKELTMNKDEKLVMTPKNISFSIVKQKCKELQ